VRDASDGLAALGMLAEVSIVTRNDHQDAIGLGQGVTEFNPAGQAADEIRRLWAWIERRLKGASAKGADFIRNRAMQGKSHVEAA
jgi:chromosome partitioning protein